LFKNNQEVLLASEYEYSVFESCDQGDLKQHLKQLQYSSDDAPAVTFQNRARELMAHALDVLSGIIFLEGEKVCSLKNTV
jgi:hypothetical protein